MTCQTRSSLRSGTLAGAPLLSRKNRTGKSACATKKFSAPGAVVTSVILGASRVEQLTDTLVAADCKLDSALKIRLDEVSIEFRRGDAGK